MKIFFCSFRSKNDLSIKLIFTQFESELFYDEVDMTVPPAKPVESQMDMAMTRPTVVVDEDIDE